MKKMSHTLQDRLILQAKEAKVTGLTKLGEAVEDGVLNAQVAKDDGQFNHDELVSTVHGALWRAACKVAVYHDLPMMDIQKVHALVAVATNDFIHNLEQLHNVKNSIGIFEVKVPGQEDKNS